MCTRVLTRAFTSCRVSALILAAILLLHGLSSPAVRAAESGPRLLFGLGPTAGEAARHRLAREAPVGMLTTWFNGTDDLRWMSIWSASVIPDLYRQGYVLHLIIYSDGPEVTLDTPHGPACGRAYPLSRQFLTDMDRLTGMWAGSAGGPPLYVTLFTEFQTYPCQDNQWTGAENYYQALKDQYRAAMAVFHDQTPNARVSLGWGGWQARWDDAALGAGRSLFPHFADIMATSDFQSFQAMAAGGNVSDVRAMTETLGAFGPVMLAHYKPEHGPQATFDADIQAMLGDDFLTGMQAAGLFAWSFMDSAGVDASDSSYQAVANAVRRYGTRAGEMVGPP